MRMALPFYITTVALASYLYFVTAASSHCEYKLEPIGCFVDDATHVSKRAMPEIIINERDPTSPAYNGKKIEWMNFDNYLPAFLCRCATAAFEKGYKVIGAQFYGECWSGPNAHKDYNKYGEADTCINKKFRSDSAALTQCDERIGADSTNYVYRIAPTSCKTYYEPIGCFHDSQIKPRPLPNYSMNERDFSIPNWNGILIDWKNWNTYSPEMICRCATLAKEKKHEIFAIQFWGECWTGIRGSANYSRDGLSTKCRGKNFDVCPCNGFNCVGMDHTNYVYQLNHVHH